MYQQWCCNCQRVFGLCRQHPGVHPSKQQMRRSQSLSSQVPAASNCMHACTGSWVHLKPPTNLLMALTGKLSALAMGGKMVVVPAQLQATMVPEQVEVDVEELHVEEGLRVDEVPQVAAGVPVLGDHRLQVHHLNSMQLSCGRLTSRGWHTTPWIVLMCWVPLMMLMTMHHPHLPWRLDRCKSFIHTDNNSYIYIYTLIHSFIPPSRAPWQYACWPRSAARCGSAFPNSPSAPPSRCSPPARPIRWS